MEVRQDVAAEALDGVERVGAERRAEAEVADAQPDQAVQAREQVRRRADEADPRRLRRQKPMHAYGSAGVRIRVRRSSAITRQRLSDSSRCSMRMRRKI